jgi:hypothetical protein
MFTQTSEYIARGNIWPGVGESLVHALTQPIIEGGFLAVEGAHCCANYFAGRGISAGLDPSLNAFLKVAESDSDRAARARHGSVSLGYDIVILRLWDRFCKETACRASMSARASSHLFKVHDFQRAAVQSSGIEALPASG